ncbi:MAG TPA: proton-conducting transporter membrane subunit, partial [Polyangia bacterium]
MTLLLAALATLALSALAAAILERDRALAVSAWGAIVAAALGIGAAGSVLFGRTAATLRWTTPLGAQGALALDPLSAWFLVPVLFVGALCAFYGRTSLAHSDRPIGMQAAGLNLAILAIAMVIVAADALTFLMAWELMTLLSYLLVTHEHDRPEVRSAGLLYLVLTHMGTCCLLALFAVLATRAGTLELAAMRAPGSIGLFALAAIGFGVKAGAWPVHVWLPAAHPVAPSHISAFLSGVVIKTGIYGLLRAALLLAPLPAWCGLALLAAGVVSAMLGVLTALAQHELKR